MSHVDDTLASWLETYESPQARPAELLCDRHAADAVAFHCVTADLDVTDLTYGELADRSRRLATVLAEAGVTAGDRVPVLLSKRPELPVVLVALQRLGAVYVPLFTAFATGAIQTRVEGAEASLVITEPSQRAKLDPIAGIEVLEVDDALEQRMAAAAPHQESAVVGGDGPMLQLYTSGTTGKPKGVVVPVRALAAFESYLTYGLGLRDEDVFWNAADPGWAYGLYYGVVATLAAGHANVLYEGGFTPESTASVMRELEVTNFAGAPTMYRALSKASDLAGLALSRASSAGEPLTPDVIDWARTALGCEVRDDYGQTELGMVICNSWDPEVAVPVKPGSMGIPLPGYAAGIVEGQIAIDVENSPLLWFTGYHEDATKSAERFTPDGRWYLTADTGRVDEDGYFFFEARDDDVILAAGYRIGPFDVESVLITHASVTDVAVVGRPDPDGVRGEQVEAFVVLAAGVEPDDALADDLKNLVRDQYSKHAYPRVVHFVEALPKTPSGKVQRYVLRRSS